MEALDQLAHSFRPRLVEHARDGTAGPGGVEAQASRLVEDEATALDPDYARRAARTMVRLATGLGPLEPLLADPRSTRSWSTGPAVSGSSGAGRSSRARCAFAADAELLHAIERILAPLGRRVDEASPMFDARLPDGSRVNVVMPPLAVDGPA